MKNQNGYEIGICALCSRSPIEVTAHHLVPKTTHTSKFVRKNFDSNKMMETIDLCGPCHKTVHATYTEKELSRCYNSLKDLKESEEIIKFVKWVRKQPFDKKIKVTWTNIRRAKNG